MDNFIYSVNATLPIFLMIIIGKLIHHLKIIDSRFVSSCNRFVYYAALPLLVFSDLAFSSNISYFDLTLVAFCAITTTAFFLIIWFGTNVFMKDRSAHGAFIQASYRSSAAILGLAFVHNMFGSAGMAPLMILGCVPLFNIFGVIILSVKGEKQESPHQLKGLLLEIMRNPIIIAIVLSLPFIFFPISLPPFAEKTISSMGSITAPLALICIGASFEGKKAIRKIKPTIWATLIKLVLIAVAILPIAIYFGFRNQELVAILIMTAGPATPTCYIMAKNTKNDAVLTSSIIVCTTLFSSVTLTFWIYLLRTFGYI